MKYYKIVVAYVVDADDEPTAQQKAVINKAIITKVVKVENVTAQVEPLIHKAHHPQPEKGLY